MKNEITPPSDASSEDANLEQRIKDLHKPAGVDFLEPKSPETDAELQKRVDKLKEGPRHYSKPSPKAEPAGTAPVRQQPTVAAVNPTQLDVAPVEAPKQTWVKAHAPQAGAHHKAPAQHLQNGAHQTPPAQHSQAEAHRKPPAQNFNFFRRVFPILSLIKIEKQTAAEKEKPSFLGNVARSVGKAMLWVGKTAVNAMVGLGKMLFASKPQQKITAAPEPIELQPMSQQSPPDSKKRAPATWTKGAGQEKGAMASAAIGSLPTTNTHPPIYTPKTPGPGGS